MTIRVDRHYGGSLCWIVQFLDDERQIDGYNNRSLKRVSTSGVCISLIVFYGLGIIICSLFSVDLFCIDGDVQFVLVDWKKED